MKQKKKKRIEYIFWLQFNEKPSVMPGCQGVAWGTGKQEKKSQLTQVITHATLSDLTMK